MKTSFLLFLFCLVCCAKLSSALKQESDSLYLFPCREFDKMLCAGSEIQPKRSWYAFDCPQPGYAGKYLRQSIVPATVAALGLGILGMTDLRSRIQENLNWNKDLKIPMYDDQLRYAPYAVGLVLPLFGLNPKHKVLHLAPLVLSANLLAEGIVFQLKERTAMARPNPALGYNSFPSQHTSTAFIAATILHHEFGSYSPWISVSGYTLAAWVAYSRVAKNYHWANDVLVGAAIGTLSTHLVYLAYDAFSDLTGKKNFAFCPYLSRAGGGLYISMVF